jgi:hypothetical protein
MKMIVATVLLAAASLRPRWRRALGHSKAHGPGKMPAAPIKAFRRGSGSGRAAGKAGLPYSLAVVQPSPPCNSIPGGSSQDQVCPKPAIILSRKNWHSSVNGAVVCLFRAQRVPRDPAPPAA